MIPKYRAWDRIRKTMYRDEDIVSINLMESKIYVKTPFANTTVIIGNTWENPELLEVKQ